VANGDVWGTDGLNHRHCSPGACDADGLTPSSNPACPKDGPTGHDCNY
jgi:hypothetical protein